MPISQIKWGAALVNTLTFEYALHNVTTDREPRDGSEWAAAPSGTRDAWVVGHDYTMTCDVVYIRNTASGSITPISGAASWQDFLDWCRGANSFRFIPDQATPSTFIDPCYLAEPMKGFGEMDAWTGRSVKIKLINQTYDFHRALAAGALYTGP